MGTSFYKSIKKVELDGSKVVALKGSCKAGDLQKKKEFVDYDDADVYDELGIKRID